MTVIIDEEAEKELRTFKEKCAKCLRGPNLLKTLVVVGCIIIVVQQITECVNKLMINIPVVTYTHFDFNKSIVYPSVTFCREPAYKYDKLLDYGLYSHPRFTSTWMSFNFSVNQDFMWDEISYNEGEFFVQYGLEGLPENVELTSTLGLVTGRCFTLSPKVQLRQASKASGYSITLQHRDIDIATSSGVCPPGYHVYVHYTREPFTEVEVYNGGLVDYLFINAGETVDAKLTVDEYVKLSKDDDPCTYLDNYSANNCTTQYVWTHVENLVGCSGPWMKSSLPRCSNYTAMRNLIRAYINTYKDHECDACPRFCRSYLYNAFVTDRQSFYVWDASTKLWSLKTGYTALQSQLYIHFNSMMVSVYEERYNYDWNIFLSDLGGNIGFLLGLSVISLMSILGSVWFEIIRPFIIRKKIKKDILSVTSSTPTAEVAVIHNKAIEKYYRDCKK